MPVQLAKAIEGLPRSEIEKVFVEAFYMAFDGGKEPTDLFPDSTEPTIS